LNTRIVADSFGGQLQNLRFDGLERLFFQAPKALYQEGSPSRGGVPVLFPQFNLSGNFDKHGFVRVMPWQVIQDSVLPSGSSAWTAQLQLTPESTRPFLSSKSRPWNYAARLTIKVLASSTQARCSLQIENLGDTPFEFTGGLHPYFYWPSAHAYIAELGLEINHTALEEFAHGIDRLLVGAPESLTLAFGANHRRLRISRFGFTQWMLWNPGPRHNLVDIEKEDWQRFICLEPITVSTPHKLIKGAVFEGGFSVALLPD
jgi:glucose-6-phosphate 1-epimerase